MGVYCDSKLEWGDLLDCLGQLLIRRVIKKKGYWGFIQLNLHLLLTCLLPHVTCCNSFCRSSSCCNVAATFLAVVWARYFFSIGVPCAWSELVGIVVASLCFRYLLSSRRSSICVVRQVGSGMNSVVGFSFDFAQKSSMVSLHPSRMYECVSGLPQVLAWVWSPLHLLQPAISFAEDGHVFAYYVHSNVFKSYYEMVKDCQHTYYCVLWWSATITITVTMFLYWWWVVRS